MKVDLEKLRLGKSALTDSVYVGVLGKDKLGFNNKIDVTNDFIKAVMDRWNGYQETIKAPDGEYIISVQKKTDKYLENERLIKIGKATEFAMKDGSKHTVFASDVDYLLEFYDREHEG